MTSAKMTPEQISKVADDVREIRKFQDESSNHGFDHTLISADITPKKLFPDIDYSLIFLTVFVVIFVAMLVPRFLSEIPKKVEDLLLVGSLLMATLTAFTAHLRFKNTIGTIVLSIGLITVVAIGFGVLTPREALDKANNMVLDRAE